MRCERRVRLAIAASVGLMLAAPVDASAATEGGVRHWATRAEASAALHAVAASPDGTMVYATGFDWTGFLTIAYHADTGEIAWSSTHGTENADGGTEIALTPDGSTVIVAGVSTGKTTGWDMGTIAYDTATGSELWARRFDRASEQGAVNGLAVSPDGSTVVTVGSATVAHDVATGRKRWARVGGTNDVVISTGGTVFVTGTVEVEPSTLPAAVTTAYAMADGHKVWRSIDHGGIVDASYGIAQSPDGAAVYVTGTTFSSETADDMVLRALDAATGAELWRTVKDGPVSGYDGGRDVAVTLGGTIIVTGESEGSGTTYDIRTVAFDPAGTRLWSARYDGHAHGSDSPFQLAVSPDGARAAVVGASQGSQGSEAVTIVYRVSTGRERWAKRFDGKTDQTDTLNGVAVSPDSSTVYVAGLEDLDKAIAIAYTS